MAKKSKRRGRGRPVTSGTTPSRQLGRVNDATWRTLRNAAKAAGLSFSAWAVQVLEIQALVDKSRRKRAKNKS